jgi:hypothetical protein
MNATYEVFNRGNLAIQAEKFSVPMAAAKALLAAMKADGEIRPGSYWEANFAKPVRRAVRAKLEAVAIWTAGFTTGEFSNRLRCVGCEVTHAGDR